MPAGQLVHQVDRHVELKGRMKRIRYGSISSPGRGRILSARPASTASAGGAQTLRRWIGPSVALLAVLVAIDRVALTRAQVQRWSDLLQLGLAFVASGLCGLAAALASSVCCPEGPAALSIGRGSL